MTQIRIWVPLPPSVNHIWRRGKGRTYLSRNYEAWLRVAQAITLDQVPRDPIPGPIEVYLTCYQGKGWRDRKRDLDNMAKPCLDFLVRRRVIAGDDHTVVKRVVIQMASHPADDEAGVDLMIRDYTGGDHA